ncbi:hypothetical protein EVG20_g4014 [Dentipellis fragilis]|uniref:Uncharacterized protein n=1 Tax=Dentipellis fragilis TaxID=205917 RepID=A0A4Y9Z1G9_9AGAM|nr:hypothetical protein EVG20_g4014 [Dentipellis fragilis]
MLPPRCLHLVGVRTKNLRVTTHIAFTAQDAGAKSQRDASQLKQAPIPRRRAKVEEEYKIDDRSGGDVLTTSVVELDTTGRFSKSYRLMAVLAQFVITRALGGVVLAWLTDALATLHPGPEQRQYSLLDGIVCEARPAAVCNHSSINLLGGAVEATEELDSARDWVQQFMTSNYAGIPQPQSQFDIVEEPISEVYL